MATSLNTPVISVVDDNRVRISHPLLGPQITFLKKDYDSGVTTIDVKNTTGFATDDYVVLGQPGAEGTEIREVSSVTDKDTLVLKVATQFAHYGDVPVSQIQYDKIGLQSTPPAGGSTYTDLSTLVISIDQLFTEYHDINASPPTEISYRAFYYNSNTTNSSDTCDGVASSGYDRGDLYAIQSEVLEDLGDKYGKLVTPAQIRRYARSAQQKLARRVAAIHLDYLTTTSTETLTTSETYSLPDRFIGMYGLELDFGSGKKKVRHFIPESFGNPDTTYYESDPHVFFRGSVWGIKPTPTSGTAYLQYAQGPTPMTSPGDNHGLPYGATPVIVDYCLFRAWRTIDEKRSHLYASDYRSGLDEYITMLADGRQGYQPKQFKVINDSFFLDDYI